MKQFTCQEYLEKFYGVNERIVEGDDLATTFVSIGAVLLAFTKFENNAVQFLSDATGLPLLFVAAVMTKADSIHLWSSDRHADLHSTLAENSTDWANVADALHSVQEELWMSRKMPEFDDFIDMLRDGYLIGGQRQWWFGSESISDGGS